MDTNLLKAEIEKFAKSENVSFLDACSYFQTSAARLKCEKTISAIAGIKRDSPEYKAILSVGYLRSLPTQIL